MANINKYELCDAVAKDKHVSGRDFRVFYLLLSHRNAKTRDCFPSNLTLANLAGVSVRAIGESLKKLKAIGYVDWQKGGAGKSNRYWFDQLGDTSPDPKKTSGQSNKRQEENCVYDVKQTRKKMHPDMQNCVIQTGSELPTNTAIEHFNEPGTVRPTGEPVPDRPHSVDVIEILHQVWIVASMPSIDDILLQSGIDDFDNVRALERALKSN